MRAPSIARPMLTGSARRLTFDPGCEEFPSFTPDGKTLVYDALVEGDYELLAHDLAAGTRRRLTRSPGWDYGAAVSPDGKDVAFVHQGDASTVRIMRLDGPPEQDAPEREPSSLARPDCCRPPCGPEPSQLSSVARASPCRSCRERPGRAHRERCTQQPAGTRRT